MSILMMGIVMAANTPTLNTPAASKYTSGSAYVVNVTLDTNTLNITNATFYYKTLTGGWTLIGDVVNTTANRLEWSTTFDTTSIVDQEGMTFNVTMTNASADPIPVSADTSLTVKNNNGNPSATFSSSTFASGRDVLLN